MNYIIWNNNNVEYRNENEGFLSVNQINSSGSQLVLTNDGLTTKSYKIFSSSIDDIQVTETAQYIVNTIFDTIYLTTVYVTFNAEFETNIENVTSNSQITFNISGNIFNYSILPQKVNSIMIYIPIQMNSNLTDFQIQVQSDITGTLKVHNFQVLMLEA